MQKKRLQKSEKSKKKHIKKGRKKKEEKKNTHSLHLDSKKKKNTPFSWLTHQLVLAIDLVVHRSSFQVRFLFSLSLPLSSSSWFAVGVLALLGFCSFFFA